MWKCEAHLVPWRLSLCMYVVRGLAGDITSLTGR